MTGSMDSGAEHRAGDNLHATNFLAHNALEACCNGEVPFAEAREMMGAGLGAIRNSPASTPEEKVMAELGLKFQKACHHDDDACLLQALVLQHLCGCTVRTLPLEIAEVSCRAYLRTSHFDDARRALRTGFETILSNPSATEQERELARQGIEVGFGPMPDDDSAVLRYEIMRKILRRAVRSA